MDPRACRKFSDFSYFWDLLADSLSLCVPRASGLRPDDGDHQCFIPKKCVHKYTGHTKGVQAIEFFPEYGHLLLRYATQRHEHTQEEDPHIRAEANGT
jgi:hypothetical protein